MTVFCLFSLRPKAWRDLDCSQILASPLLGPPPPAGSMPVLSSLGSRRCSPPASLHWAHLGGPSHHLTGSPGICRGGGVSDYRTLGESGPSRPDELAALVTSRHHILFSASTFPNEPPSGWEASGRTHCPTDHSRSRPGSGPCGLSEAESQQESRPRGKVPSPVRITVHVSGSGYRWPRYWKSSCPALRPTGPVELSAFLSGY